MPKRHLTIATRKSPLALWQANHIRDQLLSYWPDLTVSLLPMSTSGDNFTKDKLLALGGKGLFIKELEEALLDNRADLAVHSMKDVPAFFPEGLALQTICQRGNPFDALISINNIKLKSLPGGSIIGTSSLRRQAQLLAYRPDLTIAFLRGNVQTRLKKLENENYDAIILAAAGLERMDMQALITEQLSEEIMLPACGQGALGVECRTNDESLHQLLAPLNDPLTSFCVKAERLVNERLGGNCHVPVAVFCRKDKDESFLIQAKVCNENGKIIIKTEQRSSLEDLMTTADLCAKALIDDGAEKLLNSIQ